MNVLKKIYLNTYIIVLALYIYLNKGIAYGYFAEILLVFGLLLILFSIRTFEFPWTAKSILLVIFLGITAIYIGRGISSHGVMDVIRDSFMFNYILFVFIIFLFKDDLEYLKEKIFTIYKWYPTVACILFLVLSYVPAVAEFKFFGEMHLLHYKYGDMAVHLFISSLLLMNGYIKMQKRFLVINTVLIAYLFLIISSFNRGGMVSYLISFAVYIYFSTNKELKKRIVASLKYAPLILVIALPFYLSTKVEENFQGRKPGLEQLTDNVVSLFNTDKEGTLNDNTLWRLAWWGKILDYTFNGPYFLYGKGLGMSLAEDDDIAVVDTEFNELRAPHNFHLNVLARFGVPFFFLWLYWLYLHFRQIRTKNIDAFHLITLAICLMFILNACFDVFLEGPMGAFPFWTFVGLSYATEAFTDRKAGTLEKNVVVHV